MHLDLGLLIGMQVLNKSHGENSIYQLRDEEDYSTGYRARNSSGQPVGFNTVEAGMTMGIHTYVSENAGIDSPIS